MFLMTTRSSRLFVVLIHLGVLTRLPSRLPYWSETGILGVNPFSIVLERLDPNQLVGEDKVLQPHWLQDGFDGTCLGPMGGFSDCGDATLWFIIPQSRRHARRNRWIRWVTEERWETEEDGKPRGYAIQLVEDDNYLPTSVSDDFSRKECLTRRRKDDKLVVASCTNERAWSWQINGQGILYYQPKSKPYRDRQNLFGKNRKRLKPHAAANNVECVWRNSSQAVMVPCDGKSQVNVTDVQHRVVQFALVRQATAESMANGGSTGSVVNVAERQPKSRTDDQTSLEQDTTPAIRLPSTVDIAHSHASAPVAPAVHAEFMHGTRVSFGTASKESSNKQGLSPLHFLKDTNPILLAGGRRPITVYQKERIDRPATLNDLSSSSSFQMKSTVRKIQKHPYIEAANNEIWTDPKTGLQYRTDLCRYLGHDRKDYGRHTLAGVGQYMRTIFNIKVRNNE
jgi:hypothetical protein